MRWARLLLAVGLGVALPACSGQQETGRTVVASFYPLAWAAERIAGPDWEVIDLTPPGVEAHDVELTLEDRVAIEEADVVVYMGDIGFQPQVEAAVEDAGGVVIAANSPRSGAVREDPHQWLWPQLFLSRVVTPVWRGFEDMGLDTDDQYRRYRQVVRGLQALENRYRRTLVDCRYNVLIVPHEAFGYLIVRYPFRQFGLAGVSPEGEPTAGRLTEARRLIEVGEAGAVFYEAGGEMQRAIDNLAADAGVPALPLSTLESEPPSGDYISVMKDNLESLREGLGCR
jgi:zinc transport system substrate-binding protein